eukprot:COSAG05_NODE_15813_length_360_cov_1.283525_1_plen_72_part_01
MVLLAQFLKPVAGIVGRSWHFLVPERLQVRSLSSTIQELATVPQRHLMVSGLTLVRLLLGMFATGVLVVRMT